MQLLWLQLHSWGKWERVNQAKQESESKSFFVVHVAEAIDLNGNRLLACHLRMWSRTKLECMPFWLAELHPWGLRPSRNGVPLALFFVSLIRDLAHIASSSYYYTCIIFLYKTWSSLKTVTMTYISYRSNLQYCQLLGIANRIC